MIILYRDNVISNHAPYTRFDHDLEKKKVCRELFDIL